MLEEGSRANQQHGSTPPCIKHGQKNEHSPWSAPRERKRRSKPAGQEAAVLSSIEEIEFTTSPPKRHNGGAGPAARELSLHEAPLGSPFSAEAALAEPGPLAQGLFAPASAAPDTASFSPLAAGFPHLSGSGGLAAPTFAAGFLQPPQGSDKQRRHLRQGVSFKIAAFRQRGTAAAPPASSAAAGGAASDGIPLPPATFKSYLWQSAVDDADDAGPFSLPMPQQQQQQPLPVEAAPQQLEHLAPTHLPAPPPAAALCQEPPEAQAGGSSQQQQAAPPSSLARTSTGQDMDTDLRSSWGSERSADVTGWQVMQARLRDEVELMRASQQSLRDSQEEPVAAAGGRQRSALAAAVDALRASADAAASLRSSLEAPSCTERQTSLVPLRSNLGGHQWQSHMPSPAADGASPDPLLGGGRSSGSSRRRSRGSNPKWSCFSCSPFSCKQRPADDSDDEVIRRNDSEDFVIRRKQSFPPPSASPASPKDDRADNASERRRRTTLNQPPSGERGVSGRQDAFSVRSGSTPGAPWSPCSDAGSDDSFSLASGPLRSVGLRDGLEELVGAAGSEGGTPTVDALNDMLKALSLCPCAHPKDAEELVAQACQNNAIQPNATTARTLEKMWAVHEQLYG